MQRLSFRFVWVVLSSLDAQGLEELELIDECSEISDVRVVGWNMPQSCQVEILFTSWNWRKDT